MNEDTVTSPEPTVAPSRLDHSALRPILDPALEPLFWHAQRAGIYSAWWTHVPFAYWLVNETRPRVVVELGTHHGVSYSAFCEAVMRAGLPTRCHAVDTWLGDAHSGYYGEDVYEEFRRFHDERFGAFSTLLRTTFDEAIGLFADASVDLLHIDGLHTAEAVEHDFQSWFPKLSNRAVVLLHDTNERRGDFGVWRVWEQLCGRYPSFEFLHGHGLGILAVGSNPPRAVLDLCALSAPLDASVRERFAFLGERWSVATQYRIFEREARRQAEQGAEHVRTQVEQAGAGAQAQVEQAGAEARAQVEQAGAEARAQVEQAGAEARAQVEQIRAESERAVDAIRREADDRVAGAVAQADSLAHAARAATQRAEAAEAAAAANANRVSALESSTIWRATGPLRRTVEQHPGVQQAARRLLRSGSAIRAWSPRRLRGRRGARAQIRAVAASPFFDGDWYLKNYPDVAAAGLDPATHYVLHGAQERRSPGPKFDAFWYVTTHADVANSGINPLLHYMQAGMAEGREIRPLDWYARWVREYDTLDEADRAAIRQHIAELAWRPLISVVVPLYNTGERYLREMIESVRGQCYPHWELCLADDASTEPHVARTLREYAALDSRIKFGLRQSNGHVCVATNSALDLATGEFVALLDHDDLLPEHALYEVAVELNAHPEADVVYSDSDNIDDAGNRFWPYFKTDWDPDLMLGHNMVSHLGVYRRSLVEEIGRMRPGYEGSQDYDLMLRAADATTPERIRHVPTVLYHWRRQGESPSFSESSLERCVVAGRRAIRNHLERKGTRARLEPLPKASLFTRVVYALPDERPLVSVIIPTRDRAELLERCVDGLLTRTDYEPLEVIIVDNDSREPQTKDLLARLAQDRRVRIVPYAGSFNFAAMNNRAVQEARGDVVVLLNNDVEVIHSLWLEEMVSQALRPEIGAVGAKLLYPDGRVQHAGVVLGIGPTEDRPGHFFYSLPDDLRYFGFLALTRRVSAVTAACLAVRRSVYLEVGGFDEVNLPVAYNDVDLCLRIGERGYANLWTPHAALHHFESASRGADVGERAERLERDADYLKRRWGSLLSRDPYYNPNCTLAANFEPAFPPRRSKPWSPFKTATVTATVSAPVPESRAATLLGSLHRSARIIEIGPSFSPIAPKAEGWNTRTLDHATRAELVEKYTGHPGVDVNRIEDVDFVWTGGALTDAVPSDLHGTFDALIASHVIEHTTDLVGFLDTAATLLTSNGVVILAVPDKRYCFDYFRPLTTAGDVLDAHAARRSRHSRRDVFDHLAYVVNNGGVGAWAPGPVQEFNFFHSMEEAHEAFSTASDAPDSPYRDVHAWQFTPSSFELLLLDLARVGEADWLLERITPAIGCEFHASLRRGGRAAAAALTDADLRARRLSLLKATLFELQEQIEYLKGSPAAQSPPPPPNGDKAESAKSETGFLDQYVTESPSPQRVLDIFDGEWSSQMPAGSGWQTRPGSAGLFEDARITWHSTLFGGFAGRSVLELGPLEGGHSYMLQREGAERIVSVEANTRAYLKCLCVKELFGLDKVQFLLGDFVEYLRSSNEQFDVVLASGVLYHMREPVELLKLAAGSAPTVMLWTHFYDHATIRANPNLARRLGAPHKRAFDGFKYEAAEFQYAEALQSARFCGGPRPTSFWMTRQSILDTLERLGFTRVEIGFEQLDHPNGPSFAVFASR